MPNARARSGASAPAGSGRDAVRDMSESVSRSR